MQGGKDKRREGTSVLLRVPRLVQCWGTMLFQEVGEVNERRMKGHSHLDGGGHNLSRRVKVQRRDLGEPGGVGVGRSAAVAKGLKKRRRSRQLFCWREDGICVKGKKPPHDKNCNHITPKRNTCPKTKLSEKGKRTKENSPCQTQSRMQQNSARAISRLIH